MAIISMRDAAYAARPILAGEGSGLGWQTAEIRTSSPISGSMQVRAVGLPRHTLKLQLPQRMAPDIGGRWRALLLQLNGGINHLEAYDPARQFSVGGATGDRQTTAAVAKGATVIPVSGGGTLIAGDWIQVGSGVGSSQLLMVAADTALPGNVPVTQSAFWSYASGTRVRVDRPCTYFRMSGKLPEWGGVAGFGQQLQGVSVDFLEAFS